MLNVNDVRKYVWLPMRTEVTPPSLPPFKNIIKFTM
jgi:hypothetical protein